MGNADKRSNRGEQEQFLELLSRDDAMQRFERHLVMRPVGEETVPLSQSLGRVVARTLRSPVDVPPFDRALVDGYALHAADTKQASERRPVPLRVNPETIACGISPTVEVTSQSATAIATGGPLPRGADAVCMVEHTDPDEAGILIRRSLTPGQFIGFAGSDIARGETILRRGCQIGSREIGMLAACGLASVLVYRRPRVAVLSTGDELVQPGEPLPPAAIYDTNAAIVAAAVEENGGTAVTFGAIRDDEPALEATLRKALTDCDMIVLSGGTSKSAGDLSYRVVARLGHPGILAHGVALKPGKPLCLAVAGGKPVVILPGFPTSALFTFHDFVVPVLRAMCGLPPRSDVSVEATVPFRILSDLGRTEFVMVALTQQAEGLSAFPLAKGSGAISSFAQADGFLMIDALADHLAEGSRSKVILLDRDLRVPDLVIMGSHCVGLEVVIDTVADLGFATRIVSIGSTGGLAAAKRGECDIAPIHLMDPKTEIYNESFVDAEQVLVKGWRRMQGLVFRASDERFQGCTAAAVIAVALSDSDCLMVNRNQGSGTRIMIDRLLGRLRPKGYWNQPKSHNAVAAAVAQQRADWGVAIEPVARSYGLKFLAIGEEHYDFAIPLSRYENKAVRAFIDALSRDNVLQELRKTGLLP